MLNAKYKTIDLEAKADAMASYLSQEQKKQLEAKLKKFPQQFSDGLGPIENESIHLELREGAKLKHTKDYLVMIKEIVTKKEARWFCEIGIFEEANHWEWATPTFIQLKNTGDVKVLKDF